MAVLSRRSFDYCKLVASHTKSRDETIPPHNGIVVAAKVKTRWTSLTHAKKGIACLLLVCACGCSRVRDNTPEAHKQPERDYQAREKWRAGQFGYSASHTPAAPGSSRRILSEGAAASSSLIWTPIGPQPAAYDTNYGIQHWSGRVNAIAVDPTDAKIVYLGSDGGGVWRSQDGGISWAPRSDFEPSLQISSLAIDPATPTTVYAGTGVNSSSSVGILKTTDGGNTWSVLPIQFGIDKRITSIAIRPIESSTVLAGLQFYGVYRSTDGGGTWTRVLLTSQWAYVVFHPTADVAYAALGAQNSSGGIYKSLDGGATWNHLTGGLPSPNGQILLAISPSNPDIVYALFLNDDYGSPQGFYRSGDGGLTWTAQTVPSGLCTPACATIKVLAVHPQMPDVVFLGGYGLWRSVNGGLAWTDVGSNTTGPVTYLHVDQHALAFTPDGTRLYSGGDGGIWTTVLNPTDVTAYEWEDLNATLSIAQFYSIATNPSVSTMSLGGTQDNGTQLYTGSTTWKVVQCGDGLAAAVAGNSPPALFTTCSYPAAATGISINRSTDYGATWSTIYLGTGERGNLKPPIVVDPWLVNRVYTAATRVHLSEDVGASWHAISDDLTGGTGTITAIGIVPNQPEALYAGTFSGKVHLRSATGWQDRSGNLPSNPVSAIVVPRQRAQTAFVGLAANYLSNIGGTVWMTTDGGGNWTDLAIPSPPSGSGLPSSVICLVLLDSLKYSLGGRTIGSTADLIIAATPYGVFQRQSTAGGLWHPLGAGLPFAAVTGLALHPRSGVIRASTFGRGVWQISPGFADIRATAQKLPATDSPNDRLVKIALINQGTSRATNAQLEVLAQPSSSLGSPALQYALENADLGGANCRVGLTAGNIGHLHCDKASMAPGAKITLTLRIRYVAVSTMRPVRVQLDIAGVGTSDIFDPDANNNTFKIPVSWN